MFFKFSHLNQNGTKLQLKKIGKVWLFWWFLSNFNSMLIFPVNPLYVTGQSIKLNFYKNFHFWKNMFLKFLHFDQKYKLSRCKKSSIIDIGKVRFSGDFFEVTDRFDLFLWQLQLFYFHWWIKIVLCTRPGPSVFYFWIILFSNFQFWVKTFDFSSKFLWSNHSILSKNILSQIESVQSNILNFWVKSNQN